jgi:hypothetical protein
MKIFRLAKSQLSMECFAKLTPTHSVCDICKATRENCCVSEESTTIDLMPENLAADISELNITASKESAPILSPSDVSLNYIEDMKHRLNESKDKLDPIYQKWPRVSKVMKLFDPFIATKYQLAKKKNTCNITNAWMKVYELLYEFNLIPRNAEKFVYFDNAAFPGSFIVAVHHFIKTTCNIKQFEWYAVSLRHVSETNKPEYIPLNDSYGLFRNYGHRWLMSKTNDGDISNWNNICDFQTQMLAKEGSIRPVQFYSCDLGKNVPDHNNQEKHLEHLNICSIVCGLKLLDSGGNMLVKHYTLFEPFTISYIALLPELFEEVYITKPLASKRSNSETYIVCKGFLYPFNLDSVQYHVYNLFMQRAKCGDLRPMISHNCIGDTIESIRAATAEIFGEQILALEKFVRMAKHATNSTIFDKQKADVERENINIREKFLKMHIHPIDSRKKLHMIKKY